MNPIWTAEEAVDPVSSQERAVHAWRVQQLSRCGVSRDVAEIFAGTVDWHAIADLVRRGCPPDLALEIAG